MNMTNVSVLIKPDETMNDLVAELCDECDIEPNEPFAFSAIIRPSKVYAGNYYDLRINCLIPAEANPYTPESLVSSLLSQTEPENKVRYVQAPLEQWLSLFEPLLQELVSRAYPRYEKLFPDRDDLSSILYFTVTKLHNQGYYLHKTLIQKSFVNALNVECRKRKWSLLTDSLDAPVEEDEDGKPLTLMDQLADPDTLVDRVDDRDYWHDMFLRIKARMLQDMSELQFDRIMIQLKTHTVDSGTAHKLAKYRQIFNPGYIPRPNARGKNKGGQKK